MSQAEELLRGLSKHTHPVVDSDARYVVNPITRQVKTNSEKVKIMQYDHNSERLTFEVPRYVEGHDMTLCNATKVHYLNIEDNTGTQYGDTYDVEDLRVDPEDDSKVICSWLISRYATQLVGPLWFVIQYACKDDDGNLVYEWYTDINEDNEVEKSINNGESSVREYTDILEQWREKLFGTINGDGGCHITRIESLEETGIKNLRELDSGIYILHGYFNAYPNAPTYMPFDNRLVTVEKQTAGSHLFVFQTLNARVDFHEILVDESAEDGFTNTRTEIDLLTIYNKVAGLSGGLTLTDRATGKNYTVYVNDGKLTMEVV